MVYMKELDYDENLSWLDALRNMPARGYRKANTGYEAFSSYHCRFVSLGTYSHVEDAKRAVIEYRVNRLLSGIKQYNLNIDDSRVFMKRYLAFPEGLIFNLHGERMVGRVGRDGYQHGIFNNENINHHRIIATLFCERTPGKDYVNHIDGNKQNNRADNLEWVTRSENALHSIRMGLQKTNGSGLLYTKDELDYIRKHCFDHHKDVATYLGRKPDTVRHYMYRYRKEYDHVNN